MATYLADKSALGRAYRSAAVHDVLAPLLVAGDIATCGIVDLEMLYSATSPRVYAEMRDGFRALPRVPLTEDLCDRAIEVQSVLAARSQHRAVPLPDLLVAACAESAGLTVLHYDADYDRIADVTGQSVRWIVPRGTVA